MQWLSVKCICYVCSPENKVIKHHCKVKIEKMFAFISNLVLFFPKVIESFTESVLDN